MKKIACVIGTRPEAIKMAPIILALKKEPWADVEIIATAQHRELLDSALKLFDLKPNLDLNVMSHNQTLWGLTAELINKLWQYFFHKKPDIVIAQGDTTTVFAAALVSFYHKIPFCHVESGLRSASIINPFPEEMNRIVTDRLSSMHFAPTERSKLNLIQEGISANNIYVTGNTVIDALRYIQNKKIPCPVKLNKKLRMVLLTSHRRENFGEPLKAICMAIRELVATVDDIQVVYPVHPNPNVQTAVAEYLSNIPRVLLCQPIDYGAFVTLMADSYLILTDSGGIQEEATALGKPTLILRNNTERPEAIDAGVAKLVGTNQHTIFQATLELLSDKEKYITMAKKSDAYGDGKAAEYIIHAIREKFAPRRKSSKNLLSTVES